MKALVYQGARQKAVEERPLPTIKNPTDALIKITKTTICGTDLHILNGDVASCKPVRVLGHEGIGVVEAQQLLNSNLVILYLFRVLLAVANVSTVEKVFTRIVSMGGGYLVIPLMEPRQNMCLSHKQIQVFTNFPRT